MQQSTFYIRESLSGIYSGSEINALIRLIFESIFGWNITQFLLNRDKVLSIYERKKIEKIVMRLQNREPVQYILKQTEFYSLPFEVDENTLIPRPETEELVDWIISDYKNNVTGKVLDIGTGSGCIAVSLKKHLGAMEVLAIDISEKALVEIAKKNAKKNAVEVNFQLGDILVKDGKNIKKIDVIVSNPPYILESEKADMEENVLRYEPHQALFVPNNNPLLFYEAIADFAAERLNKGGALYFEINRMFGKEIAEILEKKKFFDIEIRKDLSGNDRMIKGRK